VYNNCVETDKPTIIMTHTFVGTSTVEVTTPQGTIIKVTLHHHGELDFEGHEHLTEQEFQDVMEYVTATFPSPDDAE